ncbi:MAG: hypothetical protein HFI76_06000 [Lachnospiraceae bacterium]|jgi:hypothetical protein|nr:hypothetical protein [Lachnospiraceae bacterium]
MKANTICKYSKCNLGKDGGRKHYYSCGFCVASENWRSMACCKEHYQLYMEEVRHARQSGQETDLLPDRTDLTKEEVRALQQKPLDQVKQETEQELSEYALEDGNLDLIDTVEKINKELEGADTYDHTI